MIRLDTSMLGENFNICFESKYEHATLELQKKIDGVSEESFPDNDLLKEKNQDKQIELSNESVSLSSDNIAKETIQKWREIDDKPKKRHSLSTELLYKGSKKFMEVFKDNVDMGKMFTQGRKSSAPTPFSILIEKIKLERRKNIAVKDTNGQVDYEGSFNAEWVDYNSKKDNDRVILFIHGGAYVIGSRRTHRGMTWRLSKYSNARVLGIF